MNARSLLNIGIITTSGWRAGTLVQGMGQVARDNPGLDFDLFFADYHYSPEMLYGCDAYIFLEPADFVELLPPDVPIVAMDYTFPDRDLPRAGVDDVAVGRMAGQFLLDRRFQSLGYFGMAYPADEGRCKGLRQLAEQAGTQVVRYEPPGGWGEVFDHVETRNLQRTQWWLEQLTLPAGVLCLNDEVARRLAHSCSLLSVDVPEQVAILSVDNSPLCEFSTPQLSAVEVDIPRLGCEAARMACELVRKGTCTPREFLLAPRMIVQRDSTGVYHHDDPIVAGAKRFLHQHLEEHISVDDVAQACKVPRSTLDRAFRAAEGQGPAAILRDMRMQRAQQLLVTTDLPLADVAVRCGFNYLSHFSRAFKKHLGCTPTEYRKQD
jgi:LacI family transcriptional regulator